MAEKITKVVQGVDKLFDEIVVNGKTVKSSPSARTTQLTTPAPRDNPVEGQYVGAVQLNDVIHGLKDVPLTQRVANLETGVSGIEELIPSSASSSNKLTDKSSVEGDIEDAINALDVPSVGGTGKYIKSISQVDGKIVAVEGDMSSVGGGVAFIGTRAQYEVAKLIPLGQTGHIPSGCLVILTDEDSYVKGEDQ